MRTVSSSIQNAPVPGRARQRARQGPYDSPIGRLTPSQKAMWDGMSESERELTKLLFRVPDVDLGKLGPLDRGPSRQAAAEDGRRNRRPRYVSLEEEEGEPETGSDGAYGPAGNTGHTAAYGTAEAGEKKSGAAAAYAGDAPAGKDGAGPAAVSRGGTDAAYRELLLKQAAKDPRLYSNPAFAGELNNAEQRMRRTGSDETRLADSYRPERYWREAVGGVAGALQNGINALSAFGREVQAGRYASSAMDQRFLGTLTGDEAHYDRADSLLALSADAADRALEPAVDFGSRYQAETERLYPYTGPAQRFVNRVVRGTASMAPSIVGNLLLPGSGPYINMLQSVGGAMAEAREKGADDSAALAYGVTVGIADTLLEKLVDGLGGVFGKGVLDRMLSDNVRRMAVSPAAQEALVRLGGMVGEGFEEFLSVFVGELLDVHMLGTTAMTWEALLKEAGLSFFAGALVSGLVQGAAALGRLADAGADGLTVEDMAKLLAEEVEAKLREHPAEDVDYAGKREAWEPPAEELPAYSAEPEQNPSDFAVDRTEESEYTQKQPLQKLVRVNNAQGIGFEDIEFPAFLAKYNNAQRRISIRAFDGTLMVADAIAKDSNGNIIIIEYKSSETARLTTNQRLVFESLREHEARVVGKGKGIFTGRKGGVIIPPLYEGTKVYIQKPGNVREWK